MTRAWKIAVGVILVLAVLLLAAQGDPCDSATSPDKCRQELPER